MAAKCFSLVRGRAMRATRLDGCGRVAKGACSAITSEGFVSVAFTANIDEGEAITVTNASGKTCVNDAPAPTLTGYTLVITFCEVDPELYAMLTGQSPVYDSAGDAVGFRVSGDADSSQSGFALELWSTVPGGSACDAANAGAQGSYGYLLVPFVQGGVLGDFTLENGAVTFTVQGASTKDGSGWGVGPYNVVPSENGEGGPLLEPIGPKDYLHIQLTTVAPPEAGCTCQENGDPATGLTAPAVGNSAWTWSPVDTYPPASKQVLTDSDIKPTPVTAWKKGEYAVLGDARKVYWNGTAWMDGIAPTPGGGAFAIEAEPDQSDPLTADATVEETV